MTTNSIKHRMLVEARKISATVFEDRVEKVKNLGTLETKEYIIPASVVKNKYISFILENHPEFDEDVFKNMIKTCELENTREKRDRALGAK